jgi:hypothetical protein
VLTTVPSTELARRWRTWRADPVSQECRWGVPWVERALGAGVAPGSVVVVMADTNVGKTMFSLELLRGVAESGPAVMLSLEDVELELGRRMDAAGYAHEQLQVAFPEPGDVLRALDELGGKPRVGMSPKPVAVAVDYIQCMGMDVEQLTHAIKGIRSRARAHGFVAFVTSQINATPPGVDDAGIPALNRVKGARAITECADIVFGLGRGKDRTLIVEVTKNKSGQVGSRMRYRRGEGGRLLEASTATLEPTDDEE